MGNIEMVTNQPTPLQVVDEREDELSFEEAVAGCDDDVNIATSWSASVGKIRIGFNVMQLIAIDNSVDLLADEARRFQ
jgi:hypothetical protein